MQALRNFGDRFLGRGEAAITVPPMDGALKPNRLIEDAELLATLEAPEDLATDGKSLYVADGKRVLRWQDGAGVEIAAFEGPVTALACMPNGGMVVAIDGKEIRLVGGSDDARRWKAAAGKPFVSINALSVASDGRILATEGSSEHSVERWSHDLMGLGHSGRAISIPSQGEPTEIAAGLEYAFGICSVGSDAWVSESWRHRVLALPGNGGKGQPVLARLPGYPSRLTPAAGGGFWLTVFITRTQLVEFVLREPQYRKRMMTEIDPCYWISPALTSGNTFLEPLQGAHIKTMGILKPWAPPRSYGLVIRLSAEGLPRYSLHSRVDGSNHGVVAAIEFGDALYMIAKGPKRLLRLSQTEIERELGR